MYDENNNKNNFIYISKFLIDSLMIAVGFGIEIKFTNQCGYLLTNSTILRICVSLRTLTDIILQLLFFFAFTKPIFIQHKSNTSPNDNENNNNNILESPKMAVDP